MVWCCLQKKIHVLVVFVPSIKVQIKLTKSLKKNNTQIKKSIFFVALQANSCLRSPHCCFCISHTPARAPPNDWSALRRGRYLHNTQQTQRTNIHVLCGIRTRDPRNQVISGLRLRPRDHRDRPKTMVTRVKETGNDDSNCINNTTLQHI